MKQRKTKSKGISMVICTVLLLLIWCSSAYADTQAPTQPLGLSAYNVSATRIDLIWTAATDEVGVSGYIIERSTNNLNWTQIGTCPGNQVTYSDTSGLVLNTTYYYRVKATDEAGNVSLESNFAFIKAKANNVIRIEQNDPSVSYTGSWALSTDTVLYSGSSKSTATSGNSVTFTFNGNVVSWFGSLSRGRGIANVYIDGVLQGQVDQYAPSFYSKQMIYQKYGLTDGVHTIKIEATGIRNSNATASNIDVDYIETSTSPGQVPSAPQGLVATNSNNGQVRLSWTSGGSQIEKYLIYRNDPSTGLTYRLGRSVGTSFTDYDVKPSTQYTYIVTAVDYYGVESAGATVGTTTPAYTLSEFEETDSAVSYSGSGWNSINKNWYSGSTGKQSSTAGDTVSFNFNGSGVTWYGVTGTNHGNANIYIDGQKIVTGIPTYTLPTQYKKPIYSWASWDGASGPHVLTIEVLGTKNTSASGALVDIDKFSVISPASTDTEVPTAPSGLSANCVSATQVNLLWSPSTDNIGVTGYLVERSSDNTSWVQIGTSNTASYSDNTITGDNYIKFYRIKAIDAAGNISGTSNFAWIRATAPYSIVTEQNDPSVVYTGSGWTLSNDSVLNSGSAKSTLTAGDTATFTFDGNTVGWYGSKGRGYGIAKVYIDGVLQGEVDQYAPSHGTRYLIYQKSGLAGGSHTIKIEATGTKNSAATSVRTDIDFIESADTTPPAAPTGLTADTGTLGTVTLTWNANTESDLSGYHVYRINPASGTYTSLSKVMTGTSFTDVTVEPSTNYTYILKAVNKAGATSDETTLAVTTPAFTLSKFEETDGAVTFSGPGWTTSNSKWHSGDADKRSSTAGDSVSFTFSGTGVVWQGVSANDHGFYDLYIDGVKVLSNYAAYTTPARYKKAMYSKFGLTNGQHTIRIDVLGTKPFTSSGTWIDIDGFWVTAPVSSGVPTAPADLTATAISATQINLSWTASTDDVGVTQYLIEHSPDGTTGWSQVGTSDSTNYFETTLTPGTTYYYRVKAVDAESNVSVASNTASATTIATDSEPPTAPADLTAMAVTTMQINLWWTASTDNVGVTQYLIERSPDGTTGWSQVGTSDSTNYFETTLTPGTTYYYRVKAVDAESNVSAASNTASATTLAPDTEPPTAPANLTATAVSGTQIDLSWEASTDNVGVLMYRVERSADGITGWTQFYSTNATTLSVTGLTPGATQYYRVKASDAAYNDSAPSNVASATTPVPDTEAPTAPADLTATAITTMQINLWWTASTDNVGVTQYLIERSPDGTTGWSQVGTSDSTNYFETTLTPGTTYYYRVKAVDAESNVSAASNAASATTLAPDTEPPTAPANLTATAISDTQIDLSWEASTDNVGVLMYRVERSTDGMTGWTQFYSTNATTLSVTGLTPGTTQYYRVKASDAAYNDSAPSNVASATTPGI